MRNHRTRSASVRRRTSSGRSLQRGDAIRGWNNGSWLVLRDFTRLGIRTPCMAQTLVLRCTTSGLTPSRRGLTSAFTSRRAAQLAIGESTNWGQASYTRIKHPLRDLQQTLAGGWIQAAVINRHATTSIGGKNPDRLTMPGVPPVVHPARIATMGIMSSSCTTPGGHTRRLGMKIPAEAFALAA